MVGRCGCATDRCNCTIVGGDGAQVAGNGSESNPYVITFVDPTVGGGGGTGRFSGEMVMYAGPTAPAGWYLCDGSERSRTVDAALFAVIGVAYGAGNGTSTFNLPDLVGQFPLGASGSNPRGQTGGTDVLAAGHLPSHIHSINHDHASANTTSAGLHDHATNHNDVDGSSFGTFRTAQTSGRISDNGLTATSGDHSHALNLPNYVGNSGAAGSVSPDSFLPPYQAVHYIIKA